MVQIVTSLSKENGFMCAHEIIDSKCNSKKQILGLER